MNHRDDELNYLWRLIAPAVTDVTNVIVVVGKLVRVIEWMSEMGRVDYNIASLSCRQRLYQFNARHLPCSDAARVNRRNTYNCMSAIIGVINDDDWRSSCMLQTAYVPRCRVHQQSSDLRGTRYGGRTLYYHAQAMRHIRHLLSTELSLTLAWCQTGLLQLSVVHSDTTASTQQCNEDRSLRSKMYRTCFRRSVSPADLNRTNCLTDEQGVWQSTALFSLTLERDGRWVGLHTWC